MPVELRMMDNAPPDTKRKIALVGPEQNGKSVLCCSAKKPVLFHDFDNKPETIHEWTRKYNIKNVFVMTYVDPQWPNQPTAAQDFLTNIGKLEESLDLHDLGFQVPKGTIVQTNVVDSIQTLGKAAQNYAMYNSPALRREITFGGHKVFIPNGWDSVNAEMKEVENFVLRMMALPTDTIITLHETMEQADDSTPEKKKFTGRIDVYPPRFRMLLKYFPEVWRVKLTQSVGKNNQMAYLPKVYPLPTFEFDSGTTMLLDSVEDPNIEAMIAKHEQRLRQQSSGASAPKQLARYV